MCKEKKDTMKKLLGLTFVSLTLIANVAVAESYNVRGTITSVEELYETKQSNVPTQQCRTVEVPVYGNAGGGATGGDVLMGMIIGGLLGKGVTGQDNGAAAGAVFGGVIAADKKKGQQAIVGYRNENQCETVYSTKSQQYFAGYKIRYDVLGMSGTVNRQVNQRPRVGSGIDVTVHINAN